MIFNITIGTKATSSSVNGSIVSITSAADESSNKFTVIGIHVGPGPENIKNYLDISPVTFPILIDMDMEYNWGVPGLPTTFLISPDGKMLYRAVGKRDFSTPQMQAFFTNEIDKFFK